MCKRGTAVSRIASRMPTSRTSTSYVERRRLLRSMPSPVDALPCGSRSTTSTFSPMAASAVPRLIAVVVLPTPPFWLARARTRGTTGVAVIGGSWTTVGFRKLVYKQLLRFGNAYHADDPPVWVGLARDQLSVDIPRFRGLGQFGRYILSLW